MEELGKNNIGYSKLEYDHLKNVRDWSKKYYEGNDDAHNFSHVDDVLIRAMEMAELLELDEMHRVALIYAVYGHDIASAIDRYNHHKTAFDIIAGDFDLRMTIGCMPTPEIVFDKELRGKMLKDKFFYNYNAITVHHIMACAAFEHRASGEGKFSSIISEIVAAADRDYPDPAYQMKRCLKYSKTHDKLDRLRGMVSSVEYLSEVNTAEYQGDGSYPPIYRTYYKDALQDLYDFYSDRDRVVDLASELSKDVWK